MIVILRQACSTRAVWLRYINSIFPHTHLMIRSPRKVPRARFQRASSG